MSDDPDQILVGTGIAPECSQEAIETFRPTTDSAAFQKSLNKTMHQNELPTSRSADSLNSFS